MSDTSFRPASAGRSVFRHELHSALCADGPRRAAERSAFLPQLRDQPVPGEEAERGGAVDEEALLRRESGLARPLPTFSDLMEQLGNKLREDSMILRSGHASGADQAFERGAGGAAQIFLPWASSSRTSPSARVGMRGLVIIPRSSTEPTNGAFHMAPWSILLGTS
jgi:hypothetical protein